VLNEEDKTWIKELFQEQLQAERLWVREQLEKVETTLLTEFHKWASPQEMRQRTHAAAIRALDAEVESLADRVTKLEGR
jgi:hypothetical protein